MIIFFIYVAIKHFFQNNTPMKIYSELLSTKINIKYTLIYDQISWLTNNKNINMIVFFVYAANKLIFKQNIPRNIYVENL